MKTKLTYFILATVIISNYVLAQPFNLLTASSSDKVAQSKYFTISAQQIQLFVGSSMQQPAQITTANEIIVERTVKTTSVGNENNSAYIFSVKQNYPNPFNGSTVIRYTVHTASNVTLTVYDITGREIATLVNENKLEGEYSTNFSNRSLASGAYFYRLVSVDNNGSTHSATKKMIVMN